MKFFQLIAVVVFVGVATFAHAELQPGEVVVLANNSSNESKQHAGYYARQRGIPASQVCVVDMPKVETLDRAAWDSTVRPAIRDWLTQKQLVGKIRCIVCAWDVPLKIGPQQTLDKASQRRKRLLELERARRVERLLDFITRFNGIAPGVASQPTELTVESSLQDITKGLQDALRAAELRSQAIADDTAKQQAVRELTQLSIGTAGLRVVTQNLQRTIQAGNTDPRLNNELRFGTGRLAGLNEGQSMLDGIPASLERDTNLLAIIERSTGIAGSVAWLDSQLDLLNKNETHSSFDSELSLVLEDDYPLLRWLPNYLHFNYDGSPLRELTSTLMVSRLEGPTLAISKALIDKAIAVEKQGLTGKVYLDARGLASLDAAQAPGRGTTQDYDRSLLLADKLLRENTNLEVVLDNAADLFAEGACPDVALYCGWYSLSKYVDSFTWNPGSIGYHMASGEAATIRTADSQVWCKQMLDRGVAGTIGPVFEPYLLAFPRPNEFFALLCSGKYTYIECVYRTKATTSWTITTFGDPLYNPFKAKPALTEPPAEYARLFGAAR